MTTLVAGLTISAAAAGGRAPRPIAGGIFEASGIVQVPHTTGALFVDDGRTREVFWIDLATDGSQRGGVVPVFLPGADITDLEGITAHDSWFYVVGSQSKSVGFDGDGLVRFRFDAATRRASQVQTVRGLKMWLAAHVAELRGAAQRIGDEALNIEAIAWDPRASRLLLGLRAPVVNGSALVIPLKFRDASAPLTLANLYVDGKAMRLPLQGAGIRSLEYDEHARAFRLITGSGVNAETRDFRVLQWNGLEGAGVELRELARFPRRLKPEGIASGLLNGQRAGLVVFDTSRFAFIE